jgi:hypothetical protein
MAATKIYISFKNETFPTWLSYELARVWWVESMETWPVVGNWQWSHFCLSENVHRRVLIDINKQLVLLVCTLNV